MSLTFGEPVPKEPEVGRWREVWKRVAELEVGQWLPIQGLETREQRSLYNMAKVRGISVAIRRGVVYMQRGAK